MRVSVSVRACVRVAPPRMLGTFRWAKILRKGVHLAPITQTPQSTRVYISVPS